LPTRSAQRNPIIAILEDRGIARLSELKDGGVSATSVPRLEQEGTIVRLGRGLDQLANWPRWQWKRGNGERSAPISKR
jgi:hypothetical protein